MTSEAKRARGAGEAPAPAAGAGARQPRREFFGATVLAVIAAVFVVQALRMPFSDPAWQWYTAPNIFPLAMAVCLGVAASFVAVRGLLDWCAHSKTIGAIRWAESAREWGVVRFLAASVMIAGLIFLLGKVQFYLLAPASIVVFGLAFRSDPLRDAIKSSLIAAAFIVALLFAIGKVFGIVFP